MKKFLLKYIYPIPIYTYFIVAICAILWHIASDIYSIDSYQVHTNINDVPNRDYAFVLGTGKFLKNGNLNKYYSGRIDACTELYHTKKIKKIIVSGDNSRKNYNEPQMMKIGRAHV